jgi:hypothetical protein
MVGVVIFLAASAVLVGIASYASQPSSVPRLQYRPGTPDAVVESCRQAVITAARAHAAEMGAELVRVDAASAGEMRRVGRLQSAPVEVGVVYSRPSGQEVRQGDIECRVDRRGRVVLASLPAAAR